MSDINVIQHYKFKRHLKPTGCNAWSLIHDGWQLFIVEKVERHNVCSVLSNLVLDF